MKKFENIILAITGMPGSGKWSASDYLESKYAAKTFKTSWPLRRILEILDLEIVRDNLTAISFTLRERFGQDIIARMAKREVLMENSRLSILDGVRRIGDIAAFMDEPNFFLVYVDADIRTRYERSVRRGQNSGDDTRTFEEFAREDQLETEVSILGLREHAHFVVDNTRDEASFHAEIDRLVQGILA